MIRRRYIVSALGIAGMLLTAWHNCAEAVDRTWNTGSGYASVAANWNPSPHHVPGADDKAILPYRSAGAYTVTLDVLSWPVDDFEVGSNATAYLDGNALTCNHTALIDGTLNISSGKYYGSINLNGTLQLAGGSAYDNISTQASSRIYGYGYIYNDLNGNDGEVQAQGGLLQIFLAGNDHDKGVLSAAVGATLYIIDDHDQRNEATIRLDGGTLRGYHTIPQLKNEGDSSQTAYIKGWGAIDDFVVATNAYSQIDADGSGLTNKTLALNEGFYNQTNYRPINISNNTTFSVTQSQTGIDYWNNDGEIAMTGGAIAGEQMRQRGTLTAQSGTNSVQNAIFYGHTGTTTINPGATLQITGTAHFDSNAGTNPIAGTGYFRINGSGASFSGHGQINPNVYVDNGSLVANSSGKTMRLLNALNVSGSKSAYASGGGTLQVDGAVTNYGSIYAAAGGTLTLAGNVGNHNTGVVHADGGTVNVTGVIKDGYGGDFRATGATMNVTDSIETGADNYFTAVAGGTVKFGASLNNSILSRNDALRPQGGTITLANSGQTLTNATGKIISGYGYLLEADRNLANSGTIEALGGILAVRGNISSNNVLRAADSARLDLEGALTNDGQVYTDGTGVVSVAGAAPDGNGTFTANTGGTIYLSNGFTNANLAANALQLAGGKIGIEKPGSAMTNAAGKTIAGHGNLLDSGQTLDNYGLLQAVGSLTVGGDVVNYANTIRADSAGDSLTIGGLLTNNVGGLVQLGNGASLVCSSAAGDGEYSLDNATLVVQRGFSLGSDATINDQDNAGSLIQSFDDLFNQSAGGSGFDVDQLRLEMRSLAGAINGPNTLCWLAADHGAVANGLIDNMAVGTLVFGDGDGLPESEEFELVDDSTIYAFGLVLEADALLDLGGRTIYYLREGVMVGGIKGQGFYEGGTYFNGEIVEIVPEPSMLALLLAGGLVLLLARRRGIGK